MTMHQTSKATNNYLNGNCNPANKKKRNGELKPLIFAVHTSPNLVQPWPSGMRVVHALGKRWFDSHNCNCSDLVTGGLGCRACELSGQHSLVE